jgi:hypothetical protein
MGTALDAGRPNPGNELSDGHSVQIGCRTSAVHRNQVGWAHFGKIRQYDGSGCSRDHVWTYMIESWKTLNRIVLDLVDRHPLDRRGVFTVSALLISMDAEMSRNRRRSIVKFASTSCFRFRSRMCYKHPGCRRRIVYPIRNRFSSCRHRSEPLRFPKSCRATCPS